VLLYQWDADNVLHVCSVHLMLRRRAQRKGRGWSVGRVAVVELDFFCMCVQRAEKHRAIDQKYLHYAGMTAFQIPQQLNASPGPRRHTWSSLLSNTIMF